MTLPPFTSASLDTEGELLALPHGRRVLVYRLRTGRKTTLEGHTDDVNLLRFVCGGQVLVSADNDARVRLWPRNDDGLIES